MQKEVPFAVVGSRDEVEVGGKRSRVRKYPWGMVEGEGEKRVVFFFCMIIGCNVLFMQHTDVCNCILVNEVLLLICCYF